MQSVKHGRLQRQVDWKGDMPWHVRGFVGATISNDGTQHLLSETACQPNTRGSENVEALKMCTEMAAFEQLLNHYWACSLSFIW